MRTVALSNGPIAFFTEAGQYLSIPVSALAFEDGALDVPVEYSIATDWLQYLVQTGFLWPGKATAPKPALALRAVDRGSSGNNISVAFDYAQDETLDIGVLKEDVYELVLSELPKVLGTDKALGSKPGLVFVVDSGSAPLLPAETAETPLVLDGSKVPSLGIAPHPSLIAQQGTKAFVLKGKQGDDGALIKVTISDVDPGKKTFKLSARWKKQVTGANPSAVVNAINGGFSYLIQAAAPEGGEQPPQSGSLLLRGGADAISAAAATLSKS